MTVDADARDGAQGLPRRGIATLCVMFLITGISYADRSVMTVIQEPMKHELHLTDGQLGLLAGPFFGVFYSLMGIPIARLAERFSRKAIIVASLATWSLMSVLCGAARSFVTLGAARVGVGAAESGAPPAGYSLLSSYFPARQRGRVLAVVNMAIPLGLSFGSVIGGLVAQAHGWRLAFVVVGAPGLVLAVAAWLLLVEPAKDHLDPELALIDRTPLSNRESFGRLLNSRLFLLMLVIAGLGGASTHAVSSFSASFLIRTHGLQLAQVARLMALANGVVGIAGVLLGGFLADRLARKDGRAYLLVPAIGAIGTGACLAIAYRTPLESVAAAGLVISFFFSNMIPSPSLAAVQNMVDPRLRATAAALYLSMLNVIGGLGPWSVGALSDFRAARLFSDEIGAYRLACRAGIRGGQQAGDIAHACAAASSQGLQQAMLIPVGIFFAAAMVYALAIMNSNRALKA
jgi:predicted MFS family arabinose efflux permease